MLHQFFSHHSRLLSIANHHWCDRARLVTGNLETSSYDALAEVSCVCVELVEQFRRLLEHVEDLDGATSDAGSDRVRE